MKTPFYKVYIFKHGKVYFTSDPFYNRNDALLHLHEWFDILYDDSAAIISNTGKTIFEITTKHTKDENAI